MTAAAGDHEAARLEALDRYEILDTGPEEAFEAITRLAAQLCQTPIAAISLIDRARQWFKAKIGLDVTETSRAVALCAVTIQGREPVIVPDARADPRFAGNPLVTATPGVRFYAGFPLVAPNGYCLGALSVLDRVPRRLDDARIEAMTTLASQVMTALELRRHAVALERSLAESEGRRMIAEALADVGRVLARSPSPVEVAKQIADSLRAILGVESAVVYQLDRDSACLMALAVSRASAATFDWIDVLEPGTGVVGLALRTRQPVLSPDVTTDPRLTYTTPLRARLGQTRYRSVLAVPLLVRDEPIGALAVGDEAGRVLGDAAIQLAQAFAGQAALALENARLVSAERARHAQVEALAAIERELAETLDRAQVTRRIVSTVLRLFHVGFSQLYQLDLQADSLVCAAADGWRESQTWVGRALPAGQGLAGLVVAEGRTLSTPDVLTDPRITLPAPLRELVRRDEYRAAIGVPLSAHGETLGVLVLRDVRGRVFTDDEGQLLAVFGSQAALALRNAQLYDEASRRQREAEVALAAAEGAGQALRASEERYRALVDGSIQGTYLNQGFIIRFANPAMARIFGYDRAGDLIGRDFSILIAPGELARVRASYAARLRGESGPSRYEFEGVRKNGGLVWIENLESLVTWNAEPAILGTFLDVTERRRSHAIQEQLRQVQKIEAVGRLAGGIAHDFNNLLTVIIGRSEIVRTRLGAEHPLRRDVELIHTTAARAATLTQQLLAFSRKQILQPKVLDLGDVVEAIVSMLQRMIGEDIDLRIERGPARAWVKADPGHIEQLLLNLVVNARDAMPRGGRLMIGTACVELEDRAARRLAGCPPGRYVTLAVSDTGCGMDAETRSHLFEPFFTTKERGKGTGLGLSTVYGIVRQHDGFLDVDSEVEQGSTFTVYLPFVREHPSGRATDAAPTGPRRGSETILLVEDDEQVRALTREILEAEGYTVLEAAGPGAALQLSDAYPGVVHALLSDLVMPEMSGRELAERLVTRRPDVRVAFMSGYTDDAIITRGLSDGNATTLRKPFTPDGLARAIRLVIDTPPPARRPA